MAGNLSLEDRIVIQAMKSNGHSIAEISNYIRRNKTTIYREVSKVRDINGSYDVHFAHKLTSTNMIRVKTQGISTEIIKLIENKIMTSQ